ncbi:SusC/RagA family TonB-linked outer membrane protein [Mucilaginibacter auburnensis]|uniref:TonB-linked SusC/RagA family outer membrane protein n=1 Tax=Mucilaginibacter auburnensis TaxID=1457233 RepID=A0A2H9VQG6_9SPHI|nr:TonB-dependent receptor [Mucilaginibacter auburnensis]PJJ83059.1 TonB-linked SusC/RagA family outer membrane protein [Mucilaginibacter auburnensis]
MDLYFHANFFIKRRFLLTLVFTLLFLPFIVRAQITPTVNSRLNGKIIDAQTKERLPGATIAIKGVTNSTTTDAKGEFTLVSGQPFPYTVVVTYIGYLPKELVIDGSPVTISLDIDTKQLNDVVVVGYGTQKRADITGSVSSIGKTALQQPVTSFDQALKGAAPGVQVTQTTGQPGGGVSIRIRGGSSIQGGNEPLYVIDGFPIYNAGSTAGTLSGTPVNPLSSINPGDIESIDILKDASATAIYGSRGANGVVIVTTKKGKADRSSVTYEGNYGVQTLRKKVDVLNAHDFAILRNDALYDATPAKGRFQYLTQQQIDQLGDGTDWQGSAFRNAPTQNHQLTVSGGSAKVRYLISGNYQDQKGIIRNTDFKRYGLRANVDAHPFERLKISTALTLSKADANIAPNGIVNSLLIMPPTATIYDPNGGYTLRNPFENIFANPIATINEQINKSTTNRVLGTTFAEYKIIEGLNLKVLFGADVNTISEKKYIPNSIYEGSLTRGQAGRGSLESYSWLNENTLTYDKNWGDHTINVLGGFTQQSFSRENFTASSQNFVTDELGYNSLQGGSTLIAPTSDATRWDLQSYLGRVNYNYNRRYYLTASLRADGSSRFGKGNKWGYFPSAAASWNIGNEPFFENISKTVSDLKFRLSYGKTGNLEIGEYQSLATLATYSYLFGGNMITGFAPNRIGNDRLSWEKTDQYNAGLDIGFFDNRLQLNIDAYYKKTTNLLLNVQLPWTSGFDSSLQNFGSVENKGLELAVSSQNFTGAFKWNTQFNISFNRNKVLALGNGANTYITGNYIIQVGQPLGNFFGSVTNGILQTGEEASKGKYTGSATPKPGDRLYKDINGDGTFTTAADKAIIGNAQPDFLAGLTNTFSYKGFDLLIFLQGAYGNQILNTNRQNLELFTGQQNAAASALDRWTPANPSQTIPRAKLDPAPVFSDRFIEDGSFLRLKNVNLTYNLPRTFAAKIGLSNASIYVSGQNLITWTKYTGFDPEVTSGSNVSPGTDAGIYPVAKSYFVGVRLGF